MRRLCIIPRWGGGPDHDFYPWLRESLQAETPPRFSSILSPAMPTPGTPTIDAWVHRIAQVLSEPSVDPHAPTTQAAQSNQTDPIDPKDKEDQAERLRNTVLMGHSVGCQAVLRYLARLPPGSELTAAIYVAGWFTVDRPWDSILPWIHTPLDFAVARQRARQHIVLLSDNDPFTADYQATAALFQERLGATVIVAPDRRHFNDRQEPDVLQILRTSLQ